MVTMASYAGIGYAGVFNRDLIPYPFGQCYCFVNTIADWFYRVSKVFTEKKVTVVSRERRYVKSCH